jgi:DNA-binding transcriptional MerR regulator
MNELWTIEQLATLVEMALQTACYNGQKSGRVRSLPDQRTIRYYTTIGLLDPPAEMRGRKAFYGRRHVLQLVAIKRLQTQGMSLVQIQQSLAGTDTRNLARWAVLPLDFWDKTAANLPAERPPLSADTLLAEPAEETGMTTHSSARGRGKFWAMEPNLSPLSNSTASRAVEPRAPRSAVHLPFAPGMELIIEGMDSRQLDQEALVRLSQILNNLAQVCEELRQASNPSRVAKNDSKTSYPSQPEK